MGEVSRLRTETEYILTISYPGSMGEPQIFATGKTMSIGGRCFMFPEDADMDKVSVSMHNPTELVVSVPHSQEAVPKHVCVPVTTSTTSRTSVRVSTSSPSDGTSPLEVESVRDVDISSGQKRRWGDL
eukprot:Rmarinus@m.14122